MIEPVVCVVGDVFFIIGTIFSMEIFNQTTYRSAIWNEEFNAKISFNRLWYKLLGDEPRWVEPRWVESHSVKPR